MDVKRFEGSSGYVADDHLMAVVNAAGVLRRPLLVKGEPGTGKTLLARAVADALSLPLLTWHVKSTTKANEGLYVYAVVQRLTDSRFGDRDTSDIRQYIRHLVSHGPGAGQGRGVVHIRRIALQFHPAGSG